MTKSFDRWMEKKMGLGEGELSRENIDAYVERKLEDCLEYVLENSDFYREKLKGKMWDSFESIPFTSAGDIAEGPERFLCVPARDVSRAVTMDTGGTSDRPKRLFFSREDIELTVDFFHNGMKNLIDERDRLLILMPCGTPAGIGDLLKRGVERMGAKVFPLGLLTDEEEYVKAGELIKRQGITSVTAVPSQAEKLAAIFPDLKVKTVLLSADYVSDEAVSVIERNWGAVVFEHYGMTETGLGGAVSCSAHEGYHIREGDLYFEIVDPVTGKDLPHGRWGEAVVTTFTRKAMPLLRYRTGDITRIIPDPCPCGSPVTRLDKVKDRGKTKGWFCREDT